MPRSRECRAKGQKYESDSDSDNQSNVYIKPFDDLDTVQLTEEDMTQLDSVYFTSSGSDSSRSPSTSPPRPRGTEEEPYIHSHQKLLEFLKTTGKEKAELLATNKWNSEAQKVYKLFNITTCIVHPDYLFASETLPDNKCTTILIELEKRSKKQLSNAFHPWSYLKKHLKPFLDSFVGLEDLANVFHVREIAVPLKNTFAFNIERAEKSTNYLGWYEPFTNWTKKLCKSDDVTEGTFQEYIETLFKQLSVITAGRFALRSLDLKLTLPAQKSHQEKSMPVKPDIMVQAKYPEIMLVGEVKSFGCSGLKNQEHKGKTVRLDISNLTLKTELDTDQPQGQGDQLSPNVTEKEISVASVTADEPHASTTVTSKDTDQPEEQGDQLPPPVNEKEKSVPSVTANEPCAGTTVTSKDTDQPGEQGDQLHPPVNEKEKSVPSVTADKPHAGTSKEQTGSSTKRKKSAIPSRPLDRLEEYKINKYLPQLFGQMLAALDENEGSFGEFKFKFCEVYENVQFGFAVEGFKLRFVKLTLIDVLKKERPTVRALLSGKMIKCHISITQEFNLLKRRHLEMFYQILLALRYLCW